MYFLKLIHSVKKLNSVKNSVKIFPSNSSKPRFYNKLFTDPIDLKAETSRDVVIYKYEKPKFFFMLNIFSGVQCLFWTYLGLFLFQSIKNPEVGSKGRKFWTSVLLDEKKYANALSFIAVVFGWSIFIGTLFYTVRSIRQIVLHRGGRDVTVLTYSLPGLNSKMKMPLSAISSAEHRGQAKKFVPLKIKNRYFYFLVDKTGEFENPRLFDCTVGIKRSF